MQSAALLFQKYLVLTVVWNATFRRKIELEHNLNLFVGRQMQPKGINCSIDDAASQFKFALLHISFKVWKDNAIIELLSRSFYEKKISKNTFASWKKLFDEHAINVSNADLKHNQYSKKDVLVSWRKLCMAKVAQRSRNSKLVTRYWKAWNFFAQLIHVALNYHSNTLKSKLFKQWMSESADKLKGKIVIRKQQEMVWSD